MYGMFRRMIVLAGIVGLTLGGLPALAWPGFNWEEWHALTGVTKPDITAAQAGVPGLLPLLKNSPDDPREFVTVVSWKKKRDRTMLALRLMFGTANEIDLQVGEAEILGEEVLDAYRRLHLRIPGAKDEYIPAYLLIPHQMISQPSPVMIVLHQTQAPGKAEAVGLTGDPEMAFADELARRGYMCVAPDAIGFGERIPEGGQPYDGIMDFYKAHPNWSVFDRMNFDVTRIINYLHKRGDVDKERIGIIGHSHGAYGAIMATVVEPRIALAIASCGFTTLRTDPKPERWSHLTPLIPRLGFYLDDIAQVPFDWHEIAACIAPRPFFNFATLEDDIFPNTDNLADVHEQIERLYALYNTSGKFHGELVPGEHRFPKDARERAYDWLDTQFKIERAASPAP
jgi:dienelactone hydrolase